MKNLKIFKSANLNNLNHKINTHIIKDFSITTMKNMNLTNQILRTNKTSFNNFSYTQNNHNKFNKNFLFKTNLKTFSTNEIKYNSKSNKIEN